MALFQASVRNNYLKLQDATTIAKAYKTYTRYFHNATIQENIKTIKEEEYQGIFLTELFVNVLGYTLNPNPDFNLVRERKNQTNARKADGAILKDGQALCVIELKGTKTKDLESIRKQAFDYKVNQKGCIYVITSNFEKLRFYINDATDFEEFNLFTLTETEFALLYLCLSKENIFNNLPLQIKEASIVEEEKITKRFYADYSVFKRELYRDLVKRNARRLKHLRHSELIAASLSDAQTQRELERLEKNVKLTLFKKSQKLIDRFLFIFFAEDRGLLPPNSTLKILENWNTLKDLDAHIPLYERFKLYFNHLDAGRKGTEKKAEIYAYNGGLFKPSAILDSIEIDDDLLYRHTQKLAKYDFESQVDVNILGHIFENSLNEIESVNAEIEGVEFDKQKSKRKKDGVFYTPKYITKYIVENTVGKLCQEKKEALEFKEEAYFEVKKGTHQNTKKQLLAVLDTYREWLLQITICDPACGSGAFLNQALDFLIKEHRYIDELKANILGGSLVFSDIENTILEKNIYGVDLNEEAVEIAKLSLWLRTAQPRRKLNDLSNNIKCGNSLIDSKAVAGDKAFHWQEQFPEVFAKGGFDVVIGNPPYVFARENISQLEKEYYSKKYKSSDYQVNTYILFVEKSINLIKEKGLYGLIVPNAWLMVYSGQGLRKYMLNNSKINQIVNLEGYSFEGVNVETIIVISEKEKTIENELDILLSKGKEFVFSHKRNQKDFSKNEGFEFRVFSDEISLSLTNKMKSDSVSLDSIVQIKAGLQAYEKDKGIPKQTAEDVKNRPYDYNYKFDNNTYKYLEGKDVERYNTSWSGLYLKYGENLAAPRTFDLFNGKKIIIREITGKYPNCIISTYNEDVYLYNRSNIAVIEKQGKEISLKYILAILNSSLMSYWFIKNTAKSVRKMFPKIILKDLRLFPFKEINIEEQKPFIGKVEHMLMLNQKRHEEILKFKKYFSQIQNLEELSKKLQNWHELPFVEFIKELNKTIKKEGGTPLTKKDEFEWLDLFEENKKKAQELKAEIDKTDAEINQMVYALYGLTEEEIQIVENS